MRSSAQVFVDSFERRDIHMQPFRFTQTLVDKKLCKNTHPRLRQFLELVIDVCYDVADDVVER